MSEDLQTKEIGDIIHKVQEEHGIKACPAHPYMKDGLIKSLRLNEQSLRLQKIQLIVGIVAIISIWIKGVDVGSLIINIVRAI